MFQFLSHDRKHREKSIKIRVLNTLKYFQFGTHLLQNISLKSKLQSCPYHSLKEEVIIMNVFTLWILVYLGIYAISTALS